MVQPDQTRARLDIDMGSDESVRDGVCVTLVQHVVIWPHLCPPDISVFITASRQRGQGGTVKRVEACLTAAAGIMPVRAMVEFLQQAAQRHVEGAKVWNT